MKLNATNVAKLHLRPGQRDVIVFDDTLPGLGIRLREAGSKTWIFQYRIGKLQRRFQIGAVDAIPAGKARDVAVDLYTQVRRGIDPQAQRAVAVSKAGRTFEWMANQFLAHQRQRLRPRSYAEVERHILDAAKPLHGLPVTAIDLETVAALLAKTTTERGKTTANRVRATLSACFSWAMKQGFAATNPITLTIKNDETARQRVLDDRELATIWRALPDSDFGAILKILLLTGMRKSEVSGLSWGEVNLDASLIQLSPDRTKNKRAFSVPIAPTVARILRGRERVAGRDLIFGHAGQFRGWDFAKKNLDARITEMTGAPLHAWVLHDLRRSFASGLARIGIALPTIEKCLNHESGSFGGIVAVYQHHSFAAEKREALLRWDQHIADMVEGRQPKVATLKSA